MFGLPLHPMSAHQPGGKRVEAWRDHDDDATGPQQTCDLVEKIGWVADVFDHVAENANVVSVGLVAQHIDLALQHAPAPIQRCPSPFTGKTGILHARYIVAALRRAQQEIAGAATDLE